MNFYLNLTITKFYLYFHVSLPYQSKSTVTVQSKLSSKHWQGHWWHRLCQTMAATLSRLVGIRYIFTSSNHMQTFSIACYISPSISHLCPNKSHFYVYITPFCCYIITYIGKKSIYICDPRTVGSVI